MRDYIAEANRFMYDELHIVESEVNESEQMTAGSAFGKSKKRKSHFEALKSDKEDLEDSIKIAKGRLKNNIDLMNDSDNTADEKRFYAERVKKAKDKIQEWTKELAEVNIKLSQVKR